MPRQTLRINGPVVNGAVHEPVIPVKTEAQLLLEAEIERLRAENEGLRTRPQSTSRIFLKTSEKGALSAYGLGRFPVTLYREQWEKLLGMAEEIKAFIKANDKTLKVKGQD
jgi:hypothetical protein